MISIKKRDNEVLSLRNMIGDGVSMSCQYCMTHHQSFHSSRAIAHLTFRAKNRSCGNAGDLSKDQIIINRCQLHYNETKSEL
jgi:hypothetical protein